MSIRLSVCLLTRNDENRIERVLRSVAKLADEVIIAESGSTDRTAHRAKDWGARVVPFDWDDDFGAGRNIALDQASGQWILWLNPDEEILESSCDRFREAITSAGEEFGYLVRIRHLDRSDRPDRFVETQDLRLYRLRTDFRYVGRIHPTLASTTREQYTEAKEQIIGTDLTIVHHAYDSILEPGKLKWALRLIRKELADRPGDLRTLIEYGRNLLRLDDPEGDTVMAQALEAIEDQVESPRAPIPEVATLLEYVLRVPEDRYRGRLALGQAADLALRWFPESPPILWSLAARYASQEKYHGAIVLLERLLGLGETKSYDRSLAFDPGIIGSRALMNLGDCRLALGDRSGALDCYDHLRNDPELGPKAMSRIARIESVRRVGQGGDQSGESMGEQSGSV